MVALLIEAITGEVPVTYLIVGSGVALVLKAIAVARALCRFAFALSRKEDSLL